MKRFAILVGLLVATMAPVIAAQTGGISGYVVDLATGKPMYNAAVAIYRLPMIPNASALESALTDKRGFFVNLHLEPGRYLVTANISGRTSSCVVDDVFGGITMRMKIEVGADGQRCIGPKVHSAVVNPGETADVYRIR